MAERHEADLREDPESAATGRQVPGNGDAVPGRVAGSDHVPAAAALIYTLLLQQLLLQGAI